LAEKRMLRYYEKKKEKRMLQARKSRGERLLGRVRLLGEIRYRLL